MEEAVVCRRAPEPVAAPEDAVQEPEAVPQEWRSEVAGGAGGAGHSVDARPPPGADSFDAFIPPNDLARAGTRGPSRPRIPGDRSAGEPELVVTETMAEIFLRQGHRELALAVYTQLLAPRDPAIGRVAAAAAALQQELAPPAPPRRPGAGASLRGTEPAGRSVQSFFGALSRRAGPAVAAAIHPPAFEPPRRPGGEPTRPAQDAAAV